MARISFDVEATGHRRRFVEERDHHGRHAGALKIV